MLDLTYQRVRVLEPTWFYPTMDRYWCLHGNAIRGYPPMGVTVLKCGPRNVLLSFAWSMSPSWCGSCTAAPRQEWQYNCHPNIDGSLAMQTSIVRAEYVLRGESRLRFAWIPRENVAVIIPNPKET